MHHASPYAVYHYNNSPTDYDEDDESRNSGKGPLNHESNHGPEPHLNIDNDNLLPL